MTDFSKPGTFTGKYDKFGSPINVGDYVDCLVTRGADVKYLFGKVIVHPVLGGNIFAVECKCEDPKLLEDYVLSDVFDLRKRPDGKMVEFRKELTALINKHSLENGSDTPDFILVDYLCSCFDAFNQALQAKLKQKEQK